MEEMFYPLEGKYPWLIASILFIIIALVGIAFIFAPVKVVSEQKDDSGFESRIIEESPSPISIQGAALLGESWKKYPQYTIGLEIATGLSLCGFIFCTYMLSKELVEKEAGKAEL